MKAPRRTPEESRKRRRQMPVYLEVVPCARLDTGEEVRAFVALTKWDRKVLQERKYPIGTELRAQFTRRRNVKFHRLAHAIGQLVAEQIPGFEGMQAHAVLKRLQLEAGVCCEVVQMDATPVVSAILAAAKSILGKAATDLLAKVLPAIHTIPVKVAQSIAFDEMSEESFQENMGGIYTHIVATYNTAENEDAIAQLVEIYDRDA